MESPRPITVVTDDGCRLEGELAAAAAPRCAMVLCHPHPLYGGTMRSIVISALFAALPDAGVTGLRFNFRGVEGSGGVHDEGRGEQLDVQAAVRDVAAIVPPALPVVLAGWSFGADVALSTRVERLAAWLAIAPPLRFVTSHDAVALDPRPKRLVLAEHDEVRAPAEVRDVAVSWAATEIEVVGGASHFFVGRTERVVDAALRLVDQLSS